MSNPANAYDITQPPPDATLETPSGSLRTTRITAQAKDALLNYFKEANFSESQALPRNNSPGHSGLDMIIRDRKLNHAQAANWLRNYKKKKFQIDASSYMSTPKVIANQI